MNVFDFSHGRAQRLIDERLDEERGEARLEARDAEWLDGHLSSCDACRAFEADRRKLLAAARMPKISAPEGFAARVLAAKAAGKTPAVEPEQTSGARFAIAGAITAAALIGFVAIGNIGPSSDTPGHLGISGTGGLEQGDLHVDFVVRAPGLGPAKARAQAVAIIDAHGGRYQVTGDTIIARVPRDQLVAVMRDLSKHSRYKVSRADAGELAPTLTEVTLQFDLE